jgi:hypothetical protein
LPYSQSNITNEYPLSYNALLLFVGHQIQAINFTLIAKPMIPPLVIMTHQQKSIAVQLEGDGTTNKTAGARFQFQRHRRALTLLFGGNDNTDLLFWMHKDLT